MKKNKTLLLLTFLLVFLSLHWLAPPSSEQESPPKYVGMDKCKMCHSDQYDAWAKGMMAKAYDSLILVGEEKNEKCLTCHTTGYGKEGGFKDAESTPDLKGVTCEACHGPGEQFMKKMMSGEGGGDARENAKKACVNCHTPDFTHGEGHKNLK